MDVVVDPGVPPDDAQLIAENTDVLIRMRHGWAPRPSRLRESLAPRAGLGVVLLAVCGLLLGAGGFGRGGVLVGAVLAGIPVLILSLRRRDLAGEEDDPEHREVYERLHPYEGRYVLADDLDPSSRELLARARTAVTTVLGSVVNAEGLLDDVRNGVMLPAQEWEIARLLAKLSSLRARHRETMTQDDDPGGPGIAPEVAAVAEPLARALDSSEQAVVARVEALERYAANVAEAELAYRAHHQIEELRGRLHEYEELVAESGAGGLAVPEIARLAEDAGHLERALRRSVRSAHEAFRYLEPRTSRPGTSGPGTAAS